MNDEIGVGDGRLTHHENTKKIAIRPCAGPPNCVSSLDEDKGRWVAPFLFSIDAKEAMALLYECVEAHDNGHVVVAEDNYMHAIFTSSLFRFIDDVEFSLSSDKQQIDVRSASRIGWWDFGVNRKRIEQLRKQFNEMVEEAEQAGQIG